MLICSESQSWNLSRKLFGNSDSVLLFAFLGKKKGGEDNWDCLSLEKQVIKQDEYVGNIQTDMVFSLPVFEIFSLPLLILCMGCLVLSQL